MSTARWIAFGVIILAAGAGGGTLIAEHHLGVQLAQVTQDREQAVSEADRLRKQIQEVSARQAALESEKKMLKEQVAAAGVAQPPAPQPFFESVPEDAAPVPSKTASQDAASTDRGRRGRRGQTEIDPNDPQAAAQQEQRQQEREQRFADFRNQMSDFFTGEMQKTTDPAVQQRLSQISEYAQYTMDLRRQMRDAKTDEERQALMTQFQDASNTARSLVTEQQDYMLRQSLTQSGVTDSSAQNAALAQLRSTLESPLFRFPMGGMGGFGGGPSGGFGGEGRGRGFGGGGGFGPGQGGGSAGGQGSQ
jgi:hypothetical protein